MNVARFKTAPTKPRLMERILALLGFVKHDHKWVENHIGSLRTCEHCKEHQYLSFSYGTWRTFAEPK